MRILGRFLIFSIMVALCLPTGSFGESAFNDLVIEANKCPKGSQCVPITDADMTGYEKCDDLHRGKYMWYFDRIPRYKELLEQRKKEEENKLEQWKKQLSTGCRGSEKCSCDYVPYVCTEGQRNEQCVPQKCWKRRVNFKEGEPLEFEVEDTVVEELKQRCKELNPDQQDSKKDSPAPKTGGGDAGTDSDATPAADKPKGKNIVQKAGDGIKTGAAAAAGGVKKGAETVAGGVKKGAEAVAGGVKKGASAVGNAGKTAWDKATGWMGSKPCDAADDKALRDAAAHGDKISKTQIKDGACVVASCEKGWVKSDDKSDCVRSEGECNPSDANAVEGELKKGKCIITQCARGYLVSDNGTKCDQALSEEDMLEKIDKLEDNADKMHAKEQSMENKLIGAAGIGATGIGLMNTLSANAEQKADQAAEEDMKAYLATFTCEYGGGHRVKGGDMNVSLPGGNELTALVTEYKALAASLKERKEALGMAPGIESEEIIDAAETGLYDNVGLGRQSGAYTSLSRALMDENSADAAAWAKQKEDTAKKLKTGVITAAAGAGGSLIANLIVNNRESKKNKSDEIVKKYEKEAMKQLEESVKKLPKQTFTCPDGTTGTVGETVCKCAENQRWNADAAVGGTCEPCPGNMVSTDGLECKCPSDNMRFDDRAGTCIEKDKKSECTVTSGSHLKVNSNDGTCSCLDGYDYDSASKTCKCEFPKTETNGKCENLISVSVLGNSALFANGKSTLNSDVPGLLEDMLKKLQNKCSMWVYGYTDPLGTDASNMKLSQQRAEAIKQVLETKIIELDKDVNIVSAIGRGESYCTCGVGTMPVPNDKKTNREYKICAKADATKETVVTGDDRYAPCRRVEIYTLCSDMDENALNKLLQDNNLDLNKIGDSLGTGSFDLKSLIPGKQ